MTANDVDAGRRLVGRGCRPHRQRPGGATADRLIFGSQLAAPQMMPAEVANVLRRLVRAGELSEDSASLAYADLFALQVEFFPFEAVASRVWHLRDNLTCYDAWYVALAEAMETSLATLDARLLRAPGPRCQFTVPPPRLTNGH